uniref:Uncharacterized protein n=1 Tax=Kalanchoe fedtschenkoi TaxID=63787 RepID=A0A7N0TE62_KALFE
MLNIEHQQSSSFCPSPSMGPRISFSNEFADSQQAVKIQSNYKEAPVSADFEFSISNFNTFSSLNNSAADEIFFMGKMLPLKERKTTLRDELLAGDDGFEDLIPQAPKGISRWKDRFGLMRRSGNDQKKSERRDGCLESVAEEKIPALILEDSHHTKKTTEEPLNSGCLTLTDVKG